MERLNKLLAHAGVGSRRHVEELIAAGRVAIDGRPVRELGTKVDPQAQRVSVDGQPVKVERPVYWLVNKPRGYLCTNEDPAGRPRAIDLVKLDQLPRGKARKLSLAELNELRRLARKGEAPAASGAVHARRERPAGSPDRGDKRRPPRVPKRRHLRESAE